MCSSDLGRLADQSPLDAGNTKNDPPPLADPTDVLYVAGGLLVLTVAMPLVLPGIEAK